MFQHQVREVPDWHVHVGMGGGGWFLRGMRMDGKGAVGVLGYSPYPVFRAL